MDDFKMADLFTRPTTQYVRSAMIRLRFQLSSGQFYKLRNHPDPVKRFPHPTLILGDLPLWALDVVDAWEVGQQRLAAEEAREAAAKAAEAEAEAAEKERARIAKEEAAELARQSKGIRRTRGKAA
jgi:hypothetical protein